MGLMTIGPKKLDAKESFVKATTEAVDNAQVLMINRILELEQQINEIIQSTPIEKTIEVIREIKVIEEKIVEVPKEIIKEVKVEVIKEICVEVEKPIEVIREVEKEVIKIEEKFLKVVPMWAFMTIGLEALIIIGLLVAKT